MTTKNYELIMSNYEFPTVCQQNIEYSVQVELNTENYSKEALVLLKMDAK